MKKSSWTWDMHAEEFLRKKFLPRTFGQPFLTEQFRKAADKHGVPMPADPHQWGGFARRMKVAGVITRAGFGMDSYTSPKSLWKAA